MLSAAAYTGINSNQRRDCSLNGSKRKVHTMLVSPPASLLLPSPRHPAHTSALTPKSDLSQFKQRLTCSLAVCMLGRFRSFKINFGSKQTWTFLIPEVLSTSFFTLVRFAAVSKLEQLEGRIAGKNCEHMYD